MMVPIAVLKPLKLKFLPHEWRYDIFLLFAILWARKDCGISTPLAGT
jgi:hypothetical protein